MLAHTPSVTLSSGNPWPAAIPGQYVKENYSTLIHSSESHVMRIEAHIEDP